MTLDHESMIPPAPQWRLRSRTLAAGPLPWLMGIINVTPDSFSDGGHFHDAQAAIDHGLQLAAEGATILDVGGESTRPYSTPVDEREELRRVLPVVQALCERIEVSVSIDTSKARVAREALAAGAEIINDITGLEGDPEMVAVAAETGAAVCAMHMQGTPQTMQDNPHYVDVVAEVRAYLERRRDALVEAGIARDRICLDPGIGFGKSQAHNLALLASCHRLHDLGQPLLVGHSRKGFLAKVTGQPQADPLAGTIGVALALARQQVHCLRIHDVGPVRRALQLFAACGGLPPPPAAKDPAGSC